MIRLGLSVDLPAARRASCQRRLNARPPSMHASEEPIVEVPIEFLTSGDAPQRGEDAPAVLLDRGRARVLVLVDHVLVVGLGVEAVGLVAHPRRDEGREVQARVAVEHGLVVHHLVRRRRVHLGVGEGEARRGGTHPCSGVGGLEDVGIVRHGRGPSGRRGSPARALHERPEGRRPQEVPEPPGPVTVYERDTTPSERAGIPLVRVGVARNRSHPVGAAGRRPPFSRRSPRGASCSSRRARTRRRRAPRR